MLFKPAQLAAIKAGQINLAFRRWQRPTVKSGGQLNTSVGLLAIDRVQQIERGDISPRDARRAGYESLDTLLAELDRRAGSLYRIELRYVGADPRLALREKRALAADELQTILSRLQRLDAASRIGPWTRRVLQAIDKHPHRAAAELAAILGIDKETLKTNVRKLKNMGLTISHLPGYEISPRGRTLLNYLRAHLEK